MVKQFTIPCQFKSGPSESRAVPVTFYIGHPDGAHHPIHFQSEWLSSTKGGIVSQDLMDALGKLHDLAKENGADFEDLCYYALISATEHSINGVTQKDIHKYAYEFIKKENSETMYKLDESLELQTDINKTDSEEETDSENNSDDNNTTSGNNSMPYNYTEEDEDLLLDYKDKDNASNVVNNSNISPINGKIKYGYSQDDEDLLLNIGGGENNNYNNSKKNSKTEYNYSQDDESLLLDSSISYSSDDDNDDYM